MLKLKVVAVTHIGITQTLPSQPTNQMAQTATLTPVHYCRRRAHQGNMHHFIQSTG